MRTKQVIQQEIEALQKELETAPNDFTQMTNGLYWCLYRDMDYRFLLKQNRDLYVCTVGGFLHSRDIDMNKCFSSGIYSNLRLLVPLNLPAPMEKIDVDWESIDNHWGNVWQSEDPMDFRHGEYELLKIAKWARPLLEGK